MKVTKRSKLTGALNTREIDVDRDALNAYERGNQLVQNAFPHLDADDREFLMTGITPEEWDTHMGPES